MPVLGGSDVVIYNPDPIGSVTYAPQGADGAVVVPVVGPRGPAGGFEHVQSSPSASWSITHSLGRTPTVAVYVAGELVLADVYVIDANTIAIVFPAATTGSAVLA